MAPEDSCADSASASLMTLATIRSGPTVVYVEIHSSDPESDPLTGRADFTLLSESAWGTDGAAPPRPERVPVAAPPLRRAFSRFRRE